MTAPPPTAQDGEREHPFYTRWRIKRLEQQLADRGELLTQKNEQLATQSAELAALRAQVDGLRAVLAMARDNIGNLTGVIEDAKALGLTVFVYGSTYDAAAIDAALAPPQPAAKEK